LTVVMPPHAWPKMRGYVIAKSRGLPDFSLRSSSTFEKLACETKTTFEFQNRHGCFAGEQADLAAVGERALVRQRMKD
jgi:hypothetical protein